MNAINEALQAIEDRDEAMQQFLSGKICWDELKVAEIKKQAAIQTAINSGELDEATVKILNNRAEVTI